ncbi:FAD-dependent oxidoreductase [Tunturiibacter gelidiferens]|uniref:FAD-dependent oxidoreductase n=1 Tax=Tunturiibacter gelidiferens TaxID=3069689 RepID=UPI003D9BFCE7
MAGLTTAGRALAEAGLKVLVLEARDRIGGRILTLLETRRLNSARSSYTADRRSCGL